MTSERGNDTPNPVEIMLAGWPVLYPEITGAGEQGGADEVARVREEIVRPLLDTGDLSQTFKEAREAYMRWKEALAGTEQDLDAVMGHEARFDDTSAAAFNSHLELLGDAAVKAVLEA